MEVINNRDHQLKMIAECKAYFEEVGLTDSFKAFFHSNAVKNVLREAYTSFRTKAKEIVLNLPSPAQKRGNKIFIELTDREDIYVEDVKNSFLCTVAHLLQSINYFVLVDDAIVGKFNQAFVSDSEGKMLAVASEIADGLAELLLNEFQCEVNLPAGIPDELAGILLSIGGGNPMVSFQEIEDFMKENPSDDEDGVIGINC